MPIELKPTTDPVRCSSLTNSLSPSSAATSLSPSSAATASRTFCHELLPSNYLSSPNHHRFNPESRSSENGAASNCTNNFHIGTKQWRYYDFGLKAVPSLSCLSGTAGTANVCYKQIMSLSMKTEYLG